MNQKFYNEILYVLGLKEVKKDSKKIIDRTPEKERQEATLMEQLIKVGFTEEQSMDIIINWFSRITFLKFLDERLKLVNKTKDSIFDRVNSFKELFTLFFDSVTVSKEKRSTTLFTNVPFLNSFLYEPIETETVHFEMFLLEKMENLELEPMKDGVCQNKLLFFDYLKTVLNAYTYQVGLEEADLNISTIGNIFEKLNGYKDGSFYTPAYITMYMSKETIRKALVTKTNEALNTDYKEFEELKQVDKKKLKEVLYSIRTVDPSVGSGNFLSAALHEMIVMESELGLIDFEVKIEDGNLVLNEEHDKVLFEEKYEILNRCLYGVDINPNSVSICKLRMYLELVQNLVDVEIEDSFPYIDANIKCGDALISKYKINDEDKHGEEISPVKLKEFNNLYKEYKFGKGVDRFELRRKMSELKKDMGLLNEEKLPTGLF